MLGLPCCTSLPSMGGPPTSRRFAGRGAGAACVMPRAPPAVCIPCCIHEVQACLILSMATLYLQWGPLHRHAARTALAAADGSSAAASAASAEVAAAAASSSLRAGAAASRQQRHAATAAAELPQGRNDSFVALCIAVKGNAALVSSPLRHASQWPHHERTLSHALRCTRPADECDIREWVLHHATIGVRKIYVFDTQSEPPMRPMLDDLVASGLVDYLYVTNDSEAIRFATPDPGRSINWQHPIYSFCLELYGARHRWMGGRALLGGAFVRLCTCACGTAACPRLA